MATAVMFSKVKRGKRVSPFNRFYKVIGGEEELRRFFYLALNQDATISKVNVMQDGLQMKKWKIPKVTIKPG